MDWSWKSAPLVLNPRCFGQLGNSSMVEQRTLTTFGRSQKARIYNVFLRNQPTAVPVFVRHEIEAATFSDSKNA